MDPLGILQAVIAVAVYPGGAYLGLVAVVMSLTSGSRAALRITPAEGCGVLAATLAAALTPLPGSLLTTLPPPPAFGAGSNLLPELVLVAAAVCLVTRQPWSRGALVAALSVLAPLLVIAASTATLSVQLLMTAPGGLIVSARALTAAAALAATPFLLRPLARPAQLIVLSAVTVLALALALGPLLDSLPAPAGAAIIAATAGVYGLVIRGFRRLPGDSAVLTVAAAMLGAAAVAAILVARA